MKILSITSVCPYPLKTGGHKAQYFLLDVLRKDISIHLICHDGKIQESNELRGKWQDINLINLTNESLKITKTKRAINFVTLLRRLALPFQWQRKISYLSPYLPKVSSDFEIKLKEYLSIIGYDLIQCEFMPCLNLGKILPKQSKKVFIHHELSFVCIERTLKTLNWWSKILLHYQSFKNKKVELEMLKYFDGIIVFSNIDKEKLSRYLPSSKLYVSPFAIDTKNFITINKQFVFRDKLLFMGGSVHYPNVDGLNWFLKKIWECNTLEIDLNILGQWSEKIVKKYDSIPRTYFQGFVPSINEFMEGSILIVPLRIGSGIRTKILEAFAAGMPVITTSIGVEGIEVKHGVHCLLADTPEQFVINIKLLINNTNLQSDLSKNARLFVQESYSIEKCASKRKHVLEQILKS